MLLRQVTVQSSVERRTIYDFYQKVDLGHAHRMRRWLGITVLVFLTALAWGGSAIAGPLNETRVALVIGNSVYDEAQRLPNTPNDATDMADLLERLGFEVTLVRDQDRLELADALLAFGDRAEDANVALVFFAGHGIEMGGENYLIPTDANLQNYRHIPLETISLSEVIKAVEQADKLGLVILDACRDNPFTESIEGAGAYRSISRGLARVEPEGASVLVAYAAKAGTVAADGDGRNSPYTAALLKHLDDPNTDVRLMFGRVRDAVIDATDGEQQPFFLGSLGGEAIFLAPSAPSTSQVSRQICQLQSKDAQIQLFTETMEKKMASMEPSVRDPGVLNIFDSMDANGDGCLDFIFALEGGGWCGSGGCLVI